MNPIMRRSFIRLGLIALVIGTADTLHAKEISHYLFPQFMEGSILMKDGVVNKARLNYNAASEEMVFMQKDKILALAEVTLNQIDTIYIEQRKFIYLDKKIMEVLHRSGYQLLAHYKCRVIPPGNPAGYGGTSQTSAVDSYSSWIQGGRMYELQLPDDFKVIPYSVYYLERNNEKKTFTSMGQLKKYYQNKSKLFNDYIQKNNPDFNNQLAIAQLIAFMETNI